MGVLRPKPVVAFADIQTAIGESSRSRVSSAALSPPTALQKTQIQIIDGLLQTALNRLWWHFYCPMRDLNDGETKAQYEAALANDLLGFYGYKGISRATAGSFSHISSYTGRKYTRLAIFLLAAPLWSRPASGSDAEGPGTAAVHPVCGRCERRGDGRGHQLQRLSVRFTTIGLICLRTWDDGAMASSSSTTAHVGRPSTPHYARVPYVDVIFGFCPGGAGARQRRDHRSETFRSIRGESELIPPALFLDPEDAATIETELNEAANAILYSVKSDNNTSAGDLEPDDGRCSRQARLQLRGERSQNDQVVCARSPARDRGVHRRRNHAGVLSHGRHPSPRQRCSL